jgi:hypothetical protein
MIYSGQVVDGTETVTEAKFDRSGKGGVGDKYDEVAFDSEGVLDKLMPAIEDVAAKLPQIIT